MATVATAQSTTPYRDGNHEIELEALSGGGKGARAPSFHDFVMDSAGPYSVAMALFTAGIHQGTDNPPEWPQGMKGFSERFGSNMGITAVGNGTRYGLGYLTGEDTSYHRCRCKGVLPRLGHAVISAAVARKRSDGRLTLSVPGLVAPYAATMTAVYGWYPSRYGAMDAFRMGNYNLLGTVGSNITFEFLPSKVRRLMGRFHVNSRRVSED